MPIAAVSQDVDENEPSPERIRIEGRLTDEGVECQAMRGADGKLYTLVGDLGGLEAGDEVIVHATRAEISFCMQGETLRVHAITKKSR